MKQKKGLKMSEKLYTQEQVDIEIIKNNQSHQVRIFNDLTQLLHRLEQKVDSHFHWTVGLMFGLYTMGISGLVGALGHSYGWF